MGVEYKTYLELAIGCYKFLEVARIDGEIDKNIGIFTGHIIYYYNKYINAEGSFDTGDDELSDANDVAAQTLLIAIKFLGEATAMNAREKLYTLLTLFSHFIFEIQK